MQILFVNNNGGGFADFLDINHGTSVDRFFAQQLPDSLPGDYLIRVNRQPVPRDYVLSPGDRVSITPTKISGASRHAA
ncbi:MAG: molybdopterin converting factor [Phycisphaeraceae bacterium]